MHRPAGEELLPALWKHWKHLEGPWRRQQVQVLEAHNLHQWPDPADRRRRRILKHWSESKDRVFGCCVLLRPPADSVHIHPPESQWGLAAGDRNLPVTPKHFFSLLILQNRHRTWYDQGFFYLLWSTDLQDGASVLGLPPAVLLFLICFGQQTLKKQSNIFVLLFWIFVHQWIFLRNCFSIHRRLSDHDS